MKDLKRIKRHNNTSNILKKELLCIVPEGQIEGIPDTFDDETCNFELYSKPVRQKNNSKVRMKEFLEKRIKQLQDLPQDYGMDKPASAVLHRGK